MATTIYYFTGTGNSLHVARKIAEALGESKVINIARAKGGVIEDESETIGIVFPVFYRNPPNIVKDFVKRLRLDPKAYIFAVGTCGGSAGNSLWTIDKILARNGQHLSAAFKLEMADNAYLGINIVTPPVKRDEVYMASEERIKGIIDALEKREHVYEKMKVGISSDIAGGIGSVLITDVYRLRKRFRSTDKCNGCGISQ
jgi:flavodoxin